MSGTPRALMIVPSYDALSQMPGRIRLAERCDVDEIWIDQLPDQRDALVVAATYLAVARRARVATGVVPIRSRHPVAMAQAAATLGELSGGRFILGLGIGHQFVAEFVLGQEDLPPVPATREYLAIVRALLDKGVVANEGRFFTARAEYRPPRTRVPIYLAALRPRMIRLAAAHADGIVLYLCTPEVIRTAVLPVLRKACAELDRDPAEVPVMAVVPAYSGPERADRVARMQVSINGYRLLPAYRGVLDLAAQAGASADPDLASRIALFGGPDEIRAGLERYRRSGCVPVPSPMPGTDDDFARTVEALYGR